MARRTLAQCDKEIATLKQAVSVLEGELIRRTNYAAEVERELNNLREEFDQQPDDTGAASDQVLVQARLRKSTVETVGHLMRALGAVNRTEVLVRGIHLLAREQNNLKTRVVRTVRSILSLSAH